MTGHPPEVVQAALELGVQVPENFLFLGIGEAGKHEAGCFGTEHDLRAVAGILGRLDGKPVASILALLDPAAG